MITFHGDSYSVFNEPDAGLGNFEFLFDYLERETVHLSITLSNGQRRVLTPVFAFAKSLRVDVPVGARLILIQRRTVLTKSLADFGYGGTRAKDSILGDAVTQQLHFIQESREASDLVCYASGGVPTTPPPPP